MKSLTLLPSNNITSEQTDMVLGSTQQQGLLSPEMLVVIDPKVEDYQTLAKAVLPNATVLILDSKRDGVEQITEALLQHPVSSLHIVSHGSPGCLYLGNSELCLDTLDDYASQLQTWSTITPDHQPLTLLLYGCNVAMGDGGEEFIQKLHQLTKAGIAASANPTGSNKLGGDWDLEIQRGNPIALTLVFSEEVQKDYNSVLATIRVNSVDDVTEPGDGIVTLREAIEAANNNTITDLGDTGTGTESDTIIFDPAVFDTPQTITLKNGPLTITDALTLEGTGATNLTISGNNASRVLEISQLLNQAPVNLIGITVANGYEGFETSLGGGITINGGNVYLLDCIVAENIALVGGGISVNKGSFTVQNSTISNNKAVFDGGGISVSIGSFTVQNSTISNNEAVLDGGGVLVDNGSFFAQNSTISNNKATSNGGGIFFANSNYQGPLNGLNFLVLNSTIAFNRAETGGGIILSNGSLGIIENSIIAGNSPQSITGISPDVSGSFDSYGLNLIGNPNGSTGFEQDKTITDIIQVLDVELKNNGGSTLTHALVPNLVNPAIDAGNNQPGLVFFSDFTTDQRGVDRIIDGNGDGNAVVDLGAFELQEPIQLTLGSINGIKFNDLNANGILDIGEPGIAGIAIYLDLNNNSTLDTNEPGTLTDTTGFYQFNNLEPNTYIVQEVQQPGFISTLVPNPVTIVPGLNAENINFGNGIPGILEFSNPIFSVNEDGTTNMDVMVTRTGGSVGTVDVTVLPTNGTANAGTDYNPTPITVSFINGDTTPKPIRIPIINDSRIEPNETINLALVNPTNGAALGTQNTATLTINRSDTGVPLNLGTVGDLRTVANNPLVLESGLNFSANALGIVSVEQGGSGNFIDPLSNPGQLANAITYNEGQSMIINVGDGFDQKFGFRYASPFADHQVTIYDGVNGTGNVLASVQLPRTPDSNLTPGAYILENNPTSTLFFEGIAKSVILGSQPNKLLINDITFGSIASLFELYKSNPGQTLVL
ncbi:MULTISPECIES: DUF4347 domain-containing protein [Planktothrix]|uniref:DUF4347 domain-containing protein n=1 Tax=Planktothrix TaxID=54304 RepID=UPI000403AC1D|nr:MULTISPECIES: DUF4347 domain-containing protein [Planktothrix]